MGRSECDAPQYSFRDVNRVSIGPPLIPCIIYNGMTSFCNNNHTIHVPTPKSCIGAHIAHKPLCKALQ